MHINGIDINLKILYTYLLTIMLLNRMLGGNNLPYYAHSGFAQNLLLGIYIIQSDLWLRHSCLFFLATTLYLSFHFRKDQQAWQALKALPGTVLGDIRRQCIRIRQHPQHIGITLWHTPTYLWHKSTELSQNLYDASNLIRLTIRIDRHNVMNWHGRAYVKKVRNDIYNRCHSMLYHTRKDQINDCEHMAEICVENSINYTPPILRLNDPHLENNLIHNLRKLSQAYLLPKKMAYYRESSLILMKPYVLPAEIHRLIRSYLDFKSSSKLNITAKSLFSQPSEDGKRSLATQQSNSQQSILTAPQSLKNPLPEPQTRLSITK